MKLISLPDLTRTFMAYQSCKQSGNEFAVKHEAAIEEMLENLPSGSGIDAGTKFDWDKSSPDYLVFTFGFHHLNEGGYYDGWTEHKAIITPSLPYGFELKITGRNRNMIKDYLHTIFRELFTTESFRDQQIIANQTKQNEQSKQD